MLWWFGETTLIAAILALVAALASRSARLGPATRHALWLLVLIKLMTPPLVHWPWPVVPSWTWSSPPPVVAAAELPSEEAARPPVVLWFPEAAEVSKPKGVDIERAAIVPAPVVVDSTSKAAEPPPVVLPDVRHWVAASERWLLMAWLVVSVALGVAQVVRIVRFRARLREAEPAPLWLVEEAEITGVRLGVRVPEMLVVPSLAVPVVWCLGRPKLLVPSRLVKSEGAERWRGILAHELAHLRRGDHWVGRLELVAGLFWWWNPLYWLTRRWLDAEAELACDAWVVWAFPDDRLTYAETLFHVCASLSLAKPPLPVLGIAGEGRFFERRLTMIVRDEVPCRLSAPCVLGMGLLALLALPSWTTAGLSDSSDLEEAKPVVTVLQVENPVEVQSIVVARAEEREDEADDEDDDDDDKKGAKTSKDRAPKGPKSKGSAKVGIDIDLSGVEKALGPNSEFSKSLEKLVKEIEKQFGPGSDFEKQMKQLGQKIETEVEVNFGRGSKFEKQMKDLENHAKDLEKQVIGRKDAELEKLKLDKRVKEQEARARAIAKATEARAKQLEKLAKEQEARAKDLEKRLKEKLSADARSERTKKVEPKAQAKPKPERRNREQRIKELEQKVDQLLDELKRLKGEEDEEGENEERPSKPPTAS